MGIKAKNDKLDLIASLFEAATLSDFNLCCEDDYFKQLLIHNAMKPTATVVNILIEYAERELIWIMKLTLMILNAVMGTALYLPTINSRSVLAALEEQLVWVMSKT